MKKGPMLRDELLRKVKQIELTTRKAVDDVMSGQYRSHFKGHGVQFAEHRQYVAGDDVRHIDWKVSARSREPLVKKYEEERQLTILIVVDVSQSKNFGSGERLKSEAAAEVSGMLAYAASQTGDKVGVLFFAGKVEKVIPPKSGRQHVLRIIRDILSFQAKTQTTELGDALESAARLMKHSGVIFVISDFQAKNYETGLKRLARRHDVVAVRVKDIRESELPKRGHFLFVDPETQTEKVVDLSSASFQKWMQSKLNAEESQFQGALRGGRIEHLNIQTRDDYGDAVVRFFRARARRKK